MSPIDVRDSGVKNLNSLCCLVLGFLVVVGIGSCASDSGIRYVGESKVYGTKFTEGFYGTHSRGHSSLMVRDGKKWAMVWTAIGGWPLFAWNDSVLFTAVTSASGEVNYLLHQKNFGTAAIDAEVRSYKLSALGNQKSSDMLEGRTRWRQVGDEIVWTAETEGPTSGPIEIRIKLSAIEEMAKRVRARNEKHIFGGNEFLK